MDKSTKMTTKEKLMRMIMKEIPERTRLDLDTLIEKGDQSSVERAEAMLENLHKQGYNTRDYFERCFDKRLLNNQGYVSIEFVQ